jgi:hypothetical protein
VYTIKHDKVEVDYSITRDLSNINPVRILANFIRSMQIIVMMKEFGLEKDR